MNKAYKQKRDIREDILPYLMTMGLILGTGKQFFRIWGVAVG